MITTLQTRLRLAVGLLALAAVAAVAYSARESTRAEFGRFLQVEDTRESLPVSDDALTRLAAVLDGRCCAGASLEDAVPLLADADLLVVVGEDGSVAATAGREAATLRDVQVDVDGPVLVFRATRQAPGGAEAMALQFRNAPSREIALAGGGRGALYVIGLPSPGVPDITPAEAFLGRVDRRLLLITVLTALGVLGVTFVLTRRIARPVDDLRTAAQELARGNLAKRVEARGSDEIAELGRSFNRMAEDLERQQAQQRQLVHDVAHELRTPLTSLRCRLETIADGMAPDPRAAVAGALDEVRHLAALVSDLHDVALADARELRLSMAEVVLHEVVQSAIRVAGLERDARLRVTVPAALRVNADVVRLRQVLVNLLSNAARYTPPDGVISVRARLEERDVVTEVHNTGSSLGETEVARIFDRFYRADPSRQRATGGRGLGLAIVKDLVEAQGGAVFAVSDENSVTVGFRLPSVDGAEGADGR